MKFPIYHILLSFFLIITGALTTGSIYFTGRNISHALHENYTVNTTLADIDAIADNYAPPNRIYSYRETVELRQNLMNQLKVNSRSLALHWALLKNYANAPDFNGGNLVIALQYAGYIYSINGYIGCLAYEYVYNKRKQPDMAEEWYNKSLNIKLPQNMYWQEIKYTNTPQFNVEVMGNFNNWKLQNMYQTLSGIYSRKVMVPKCERCIYKCIVDNVRKTDPSKTTELTKNSY